MCSPHIQLLFASWHNCTSYQKSCCSHSKSKAVRSLTENGVLTDKVVYLETKSYYSGWSVKLNLESNTNLVFHLSVDMVKIVFCCLVDLDLEQYVHHISYHSNINWNVFVLMPNLRVWPSYPAGVLITQCQIPTIIDISYSDGQIIQCYFSFYLSYLLARAEGNTKTTPWWKSLPGGTYCK